MVLRVLGFDGRLRVSAGGRTWGTLEILFAPAVLVFAPSAGTVLAATEDCLLRSPDIGATREPWTPRS